MNSANAPQILPIASSSVPYTPFDTLWIPDTAKFVVLGENPRRTGTIAIYRLDFGNKNTLKLRSKNDKEFGFKCGTFGHSYNKHHESSRQLATGDFKGNLNIWDLEKITKPVFEVQNAHQDIINSIDGISGNHGASEIVTGSRDGTVKVWDPRSNKAVAEMRASHSGKSRDCWSVCFGNSFDAQNRMIAAGYDNGDVKILDLRSNKLFYELNVNNGVCCVEFDRKDIKLNKLIITALQSQYRVYDLKTKHISEGFPYSSIETNSKQTTIWKCKHLPQQRDIWITCLGDGTVRCYQYKYPEQRCVVDDKGHKKGVMGSVKLLTNPALSALSTQPIISWDWNRSKTGLACMASLDQTVQVIIVTKLSTL